MVTAGRQACYRGFCREGGHGAVLIPYQLDHLDQVLSQGAHDGPHLLDWRWCTAGGGLRGRRSLYSANRILWSLSGQCIGLTSLSVALFGSSPPAGSLLIISGTVAIDRVGVPVQDPVI